MHRFLTHSPRPPAPSPGKQPLGAQLRRTMGRYKWALLVAGMIFVLFSGTALAAEIAGGDSYILPRGEVVQDDLYASGDEVIIDGTVEGDLVVAGAYVEVNGVVNGDLMAAGAAVVVNGAVQDDARVAGASVTIAGTIGDDLFAAAGGGWPGANMVPMEFGGRSVTQGLQVTNDATVSGDAYVAGGTLTLAGSYGSSLNAGGSIVDFRGNVTGDARLYAETLSVSESAQVQGELRYSTGSDITVPEGAAGTVTREPWSPDREETEPQPRNILGSLFNWLLRSVLVIIGLLVVGWLLWSLAPRTVTRPVSQVEDQPVMAVIFGLLVAVAMVPVSAALVFLAVLFWGWFPGGVVMLSFTFGFFALLWILSPAIAGLWIGRLILRRGREDGSDLAALLTGIVVIVLAARLLLLIPCLGELAYRAVYLASFALAAGGWILAWRGPGAPAPASPGSSLSSSSSGSASEPSTPT